LDSGDLDFEKTRLTFSSKNLFPDSIMKGFLPHRSFEKFAISTPKVGDPQTAWDDVLPPRMRVEGGTRPSCDLWEVLTFLPPPPPWIAGGIRETLRKSHPQPPFFSTVFPLASNNI